MGLDGVAHRSSGHEIHNAVAKDVVRSGGGSVASAALGGVEGASGGLEDLLEHVHIKEELGAHGGEKVDVTSNVGGSHAGARVGGIAAARGARPHGAARGNNAGGLPAANRATAGVGGNGVRVHGGGANGDHRLLGGGRVNHGSAGGTRVTGADTHEDASNPEGLDSLSEFVPRATLSGDAAVAVANSLGANIRVRAVALEVGGGEEKLEAAHVAGHRAVAPIHVPAGDPFGSGGHTDATLAHSGTGGVGAVSVVIYKNEESGW